MWQLSLGLPHSLARFSQRLLPALLMMPVQMSEVVVFGPGPKTLFDIRIFHPDAASYAEKPLEQLLLQHERQKNQLEYNERITNVDRGTFCPLVFTTAGATSPECAKLLQRLCGMLAQLDSMHYAQTVWYVRCRLSFALLRASILCLRGSRSAYASANKCFARTCNSRGRARGLRYSSLLFPLVLLLLYFDDKM